MKRLILAIAIVLLLPVFVFAHRYVRDYEPLSISKIKKESEYDNHFRKSQWGMSKKEILRSEKLKKQHENQDNLIFKGEVAGLNTVIMYSFFKGKLAGGYYFFNVKHTAKNKYIDDFIAIDHLLEKKYGKPISKKDKWSNSLYKDRPEGWGMAISLGHLAKLTAWETESTKIEHIIHGDNFKINHAVMYSSKILSKEREKVEEGNTLDDL